MNQKTMKLNNGVDMPLVGLGTWDLRGQECIESVSKAISLGYRLIDTAQMYGNEVEVGKGIAQSGIKRDELFVTTKIYRISNSYEKAKEAIDLSLERLGLEYVDLMLLHEPYQEGPEMYKALEEAVKEGKVKSIGISNYNQKWLEGFMRQCQIVPVINQLETHVYFQRAEFQAQQEAQGIKIQAWAPLAQGIGNVAGNVLLSKIGEKYGKTAAQIALKSLIQRGIGVIPKSKHESRLIENISLFDFVLSDSELAEIKSLDKDKTLFPWTEAF